MERRLFLKFEELEKDAVTNIRGFKIIVERGVIVGDNESGCDMCQTLTKYIDYCCGGRFCSTECQDTFYKVYTESLNKTVYESEDTV